MIIKAYNEKHPYLLFIDVEFFSSKKDNQTENHLVQFAGLLFKRIDDETYQLMRSCNEYVTDKVCYPFAEYTSITNNFLANNGMPLENVLISIKEDFLEGINYDEIMIISHGLKNDRIILNDAGLRLERSNGQMVDGYCTFTNARRILGRQNELTLTDLCRECGYYIHQAHNAYNDVWGEVAVFTYLKKVEAQE